MKNATRELLLITKAARHWGEGKFTDHVNDLMDLAGQVDTPTHFSKVTEVLDVYHHSLTTAPCDADGKHPARRPERKPFAFTAFRN